MTGEERQKLCAWLRTLSHPTVLQAADELERLESELKREEAENEHYVRLAFVDAGANPAMTWKQEAERLAALAQSNAEPVAWRYRVKSSSSWFVALKDDCDAAYWRASNYEVEPLYTARVINNGEIR